MIMSFRTNRRTRRKFRIEYSGPITIYNEDEISRVIEIAKSQGKPEIHISRRGRAIDIYYGRKIKE